MFLFKYQIRDNETVKYEFCDIRTLNLIALESVM